MQNIKPVVINSEKTKPGTRYQWDSMGDFIKEFTSAIKSSFGESDGQKPNISNAVSGLPSAFARSNMFTYALNSPAVSGPTSGLNSFYATLLDEWKGLVSAFVLEEDSTAFQVKRVWLTYTDGDGTIEQTTHIYEPKGAFGNALFERKQLWEDQDNIGDSARLKRPFIDIIYYKGKVVGGTSPESLAFTSPGYKFDGVDLQKVFVSETQGKFTDPINAEGKLTAKQLNQLLSYVEKLTQRITPFFASYKKSEHLWPERVDQNIGQFLGTWASKIKEYANKHNIAIDAAKPEVSFFELNPFKTLFNVENVYYADIDSNIFSSDDSNVSADWLQFKLEDLLLNPDQTILAELNINDLEGLPISALEVEDPDYAGKKLYFTIPLSPLGLKVFQRKGKLESLLSGKDASASCLVTLYDSTNQILNVKLELKRDGKSIATTPQVPFKTSADPNFGKKHLVLWPNFVHPNWNKYYLYSEMPHNSPTGWQAYPILGSFTEEHNSVDILDKDFGAQIGLKENQLPKSNNDFVRLADDGTANGDLGKVLVGNIKNLSSFKYEVYESSKPIRGIEIRNAGKTSGFLFIKYGGTNEDSSFVSQMPKSHMPAPTRVGVDFGSNNSCVAYIDLSNTPYLLKFKNRRISFFHSDAEQNESNATAPADAFEMLFFQNDEPMSNRIKSMMTIHEETRLVDDKNNGNINHLYEEAVKGGMTCYESNIAIEDSTANRHILALQKIPDQKVNIVYNMKWSNDEREEAHKIAFLKAIMLQTYAELFMRREGALYPKTVAWAYPSSMSKARVNTYSTKIWSKIKDCNPLSVENSNMEVLLASTGRVKTGEGLNSGGMQGGMAGGMQGGMAGGMQGGMAGGMAGGMQGGMAGGMAGGMQGGMAGGMAGGMQGGMSGGMQGGMGNAGGSGKLIELELPEEIQKQISPNFTPRTISQPKPVVASRAMTESQAVACFAGTNNPGPGQFVLGFDVGGSTTDILAVTNVGGSSTLVKQNSVKLAAGMLADATKLIPGFNNFLKDYSIRHLGKIHGIENMTPNTTPFYFNLVLDRLDSNDKLDDFYRNIASSNKQLMWLNLYVTGLNIFYSGMVARKLYEQTEKNEALFFKKLEFIKIEFYGKGSRIFDWFKAIDPDTAFSYYTLCFAKGFGEQEANNLFMPRRNFFISNFDNFTSSINPDNVKTEVAKGLAMQDYPISEFDEDMGEIFGEDGYLIRVPGQPQPISLSSLMDINPSMMQRLGSEIIPPSPGPNAYPRFVSFMNLFYDYATQTLDFPPAGQEIMQAISTMNILTELRNDEDYKEAMKATDFDFVAPLIILQGQAFLKSYLLPKIQKG